jgi:hypothetical protein
LNTTAVLDIARSMPAKTAGRTSPKYQIVAAVPTAPQRSTWGTPTRAISRPMPISFGNENSSPTANRRTTTPISASNSTVLTSWTMLRP